jgi:hypothetical protein
MMLRRLYAATPRGILAATASGPPCMSKIMKIAKSAMIDEAKPVGFHLVKDFEFLPYRYFLVFQH